MTEHHRSYAARRDGLDVGADQYPYTAAATTRSTILPPASLARSLDAAGAAIRDPASRREIPSYSRSAHGASRSSSFSPSD